MIKRLLVLSLAITLSSCSKDAPSPQDTTPSKQARCSMLRHKILETSSAKGGSTTSVDDAQSNDYQQAYKNECE